MKNGASILALMALVLAGCVSPRKIVFIDEASRPGPPTIQEVRAQGEQLRVTLVQDSAPAYVAGVNAEVIDGDVYLSTLHISSVVQQTEFVVDLSDPKFPRDWRSRLYWLSGDSISQVNPSIKHVREILRARIHLAE